MPYAPHLRMTMLGRIGNPEFERFSMSINLDGYGDGIGTTIEERAIDMAEDCRAFFTTASVGISGACTLEEVKFAQIGTDGLYLDDPIIVPILAPSGGVSSAVSPPPQVALAVSLVTARRGPTGKGRFYLPVPAFALDAQLHLTESQRDGVQAACAVFLSDLQNSPGIDGNGPKVVVASTKGYNTPITGVRVGRTLDTIRSRRRSLSEEHQAPTLVT